MIKETTVAQNVQVQQRSHKLLVTSLLWAGLGFILVFALSSLYSFLIKTYWHNILMNDSYLITSSILLIVFIGIIFYTNIMWSRNVTGASFGLITLSLILNVILFSGMIAPLITLIDQPILVYAIFGVTGGIMLICGLIGYCILKTASAISLTKLLTTLISILFIGQLLFILPFGFFFSNAASIFYLVYNIIFSVAIVILITLTFYRISKMSEFYKDLNKSEQIKLSLFCGLEILNAFVLLLLQILRFVIVFAKN